MINSIKIYFASFEQPLSKGDFEAYARQLPSKQYERVYKFRRWEDAHAAMFGKLLLLKGLRDLGYDKSLEDIKYTEKGRPFFNDCIDFNISHSGYYILCGFSQSSNIGVDIEEIRQIAIKDFKNQFTEEEWMDIAGSTQPFRTFYKYWTIKEAAIKVDGRGLSMPLKEVVTQKDYVYLGGQTLFYKSIEWPGEYKVHVASDRPIDEVLIEKVEF